MDARFEDDMIEIAGDDNYLMLCGGRKMLFLDGAAEGKVPLDQVASFAHDGASILIDVLDRGTLRQPFPSAPAGFAEEAAAKLNRAAEGWR